MTTLIDFSAAWPAPEAIRAAGHAGLIAYLSDSRPGANFGAKPLTREWADRYRAAGLEVVTNYQFGKGATSDWRGGFDAGVKHARRALELHFAAGGPGFRPLYAPVDDNPTLDEFNRLIAPFLRGWESVVGHEWTGVYGNSLVHAWAQEDGLGSWWWLHNWGGDRTPTERTHLHQVRIDKDRVGGVGVDINEALRDDYGQWSRAVTPAAPAPVPTPLPPKEHPVADTYPVDVTDLSDADSGLRSATQGIALHTNEPGPYRRPPSTPSTVEQLLAFCKPRKNGASYNTTVGRDGRSGRSNSDEFAPWAAGQTGNARLFHICLHGWAAQSREEWLSYPEQIEETAQQVAFYARKYDIPLAKIDGGTLRAGGKGIVGHADVSAAWREVDHTDPGPGYPYDVVIARAAAILGGPAAAVVQEQAYGGAIKKHVEQTPGLAEQLGAPVDGLEHHTPDGRGRWTRFDHGTAWWTPWTGAYAVWGANLAAYEADRFEVGDLGYPTSDEIDWPGVGRLSLFEGGYILYRWGAERSEVHAVKQAA